ncbi:iron transporter [Sorangium cellulosum]|uniref:Iron transporter n=1 Tax=Sorangium cellulosum TaxID=56 RepID=A0A2L0EWQ7_SORCE|nr:cation diffusion facilitator family transporter [Sorangium cellulosum]AUX43738.1 iron transporter [Sorangium cellulosum]
MLPADPSARPGPAAGPDPAARAADRAHAALRAGRLAALTAGGLALGKLVAGQLGHSMAVTASAVDSLTDLFASSANALAIQLAHAAPDRSHPFGHAKIETLATAGQGLLIGGSGVYLLVEGVRRLLSPQPLRLAAVTLGAMAVAAAITAALVAYLGRVAARTGSSAIQADAIHYRTDIAANVAVFLGVALTYATGLSRVDGVLSIAVAAYVLYSAGSLLRLGVRDLIDTSASEDRVAAIEAALGAMRARGEILGHHALRTRVAGPTLFVDVHIELPGDLPLARAHATGDRARDAILAVELDAEVLVHIDPGRDQPA